MTYNRRDGVELSGVFWCPGRVTRVKSDSRGGWIFVEYDDKSSGWLLASRASFFNATKPGAWRFEVTDAAGSELESGEDADDELVDADDGESAWESEGMCDE